MQKDKLDKWNKLYNEYLDSGLSCIKWCELNKIKPHQFFYIRKQLGVVKTKSNEHKKKIFMKVDIIEDVGTFSFKINGLLVEVASDISKEHLTLLMEGANLL
ncbi:MAG: IS66 family insertion sequence element accessory protein TnpA [Bacilli bacterium]